MTTNSADDQSQELVTSTLLRAYGHMVNGDLDALMTLYLPDAVIQNSSMIAIEGVEAIRGFWEQVFATFQLTATPEVTQVQTEGTLFIVRGSATGSLRPRAGGADQPINIWFHQLYRLRKDGTLRFWRGANGPNP